MYTVSLFRFSEYRLLPIYMQYRHDNSTCNWQAAVGLFDALTFLENLPICIPARITRVLSRENKKGEAYWQNKMEKSKEILYSLSIKVYTYIYMYPHRTLLLFKFFIISDYIVIYMYLLFFQNIFDSYRCIL